MGSSWPVKKLKDLGVTLIDCVHKTPKAVEVGIPYIGIPQMKSGAIDFDASPRLISEEDFIQWTIKANPSYGDIILSRRCNPGETAYVPKNTKFALGQNLVLLRPNPETIHPGYLRWAVNSPQWWSEVNKYRNPGAVFDSLKCADIPNFEIPAPPYSVQKDIDNTFSAISNKIEINRQINHTLEKMAQTLFKSWFVDFDPVIDNALDAGNSIPDELQARAEQRQALRNAATQQGDASATTAGSAKPLPDNIRQLFPNEFEESELGWVPKGWTPSNVGVEFDVTMGQSPPGSTYNETGEGLPFFQGKTDFCFRYPSNRIYCTAPKRLATKQDTLISVRAPVGAINLAAENCCIGRGLAAVKHKSGSASFTYYSMNNLSRNFEVFEGEGTVFGSINQKDFKALPQLKLPVSVIELFDKFCIQWDKKVEVLTSQISNLTQVRDTLLPKLISGELRLDDVEATIEETITA